MHGGHVVTNLCLCIAGSELAANASSLVGVFLGIVLFEEAVDGLSELLLVGWVMWVMGDAVQIDESEQLPCVIVVGYKVDKVRFTCEVVYCEPGEFSIAEIWEYLG